MRTGRQGLMGLLAVTLALGWVGTALAQPFPPGGLPVCQATLSQCTADLGTCETALAAAQEFPATGQTTCYNSSHVATDCVNTSGQDGNIRAGAMLSYTDNSDGTITDNNTGLMWAKKDDNNSDPLHDKDTTYTWPDAFGVHIAGLNTASFAGYTDWRLPNVKELQSIVNYQIYGLAVSSEFNTGCAASCNVLTCSCTGGGGVFKSWSSTSFAPEFGLAWLVDFYFGRVDAEIKDGTSHLVRAVRGGLD